MIAGMCRGLTGFWCTDGYAVCGYAEAAATSKDIVVSVDDVGVSKTPGLRVNAPPSADRCSADSRRSLLFESNPWLVPVFLRRNGCSRRVLKFSATNGRRHQLQTGAKGGRVG